MCSLSRIICHAKMVNKWYVFRRATPIVDDAQPLSNDGYLATRGFAANARAERKQINRDRLRFAARALNASFNMSIRYVSKGTDTGVEPSYAKRAIFSTVFSFLLRIYSARQMSSLTTIPRDRNFASTFKLNFLTFMDTKRFRYRFKWTIFHLEV